MPEHRVYEVCGIYVDTFHGDFCVQENRKTREGSNCPKERHFVARDLMGDTRVVDNALMDFRPNETMIFDTLALYSGGPMQISYAHTPYGVR